MPAVSVIVPLYNRSHYLETAVDSILKQTFQDFEIIIVDDGSKDNVKPIVDKCIKKSASKVTYHYQENQGAGAARNNGIRRAKGDYIAFLDADDEWLSTYLEKTVNMLNNKNLDWVCTGSCRLELNEREEEVSRRDIHTGTIGQDLDVYGELLKENNIIGGPSQVVLKAECTKAAGVYREDLPVREDWEYWLRLAKNNLKVERVDEPLYIYKIRTNSITKTDRSVGMRSSYKVFTEYSADAFRRDPSNRLLYAEKLWNLARHVARSPKKDAVLFIKCIIKSQMISPSLSRFAKSAGSNLKKKPGICHEA